MKKKTNNYQQRKNKHSDLSRPLNLGSEEDLKVLIKTHDDPLLLILDGIQDPHNLGACLRTADGAGVHAVVSSKHRSVPITETVRSIACGAAENIPFIQVTNLRNTMQWLKEEGIWFVGTSDQAQQFVYDIDLTGPIAFVLGAEGSGMRRLTMETCDYLVKIPMQGVVECLNVSVSAGICLYEAVRQRLIVS